MSRFKKIITPTIAGIIYIVLIGTVLAGSSSITDIGTTIGLQIVLFIFLPFAYLGRSKNILLRLSAIILLGGLLISSISLLFLNISAAIFLFLSHFTLSLYTLSRFYLTRGAKKRYYRTTSHEGLGTVAIMLALSYTATIWVAGSAAKLDCENIYTQSVGVINKFIPWKSGSSSSRADQINIFGSKSVGQLLGVSGNHEDTIQINGENSPQAAEQEVLGKKFVPIVGSGTYSGDSKIEENQHSEGLLEKFLTYQTKQINSLLENQSIINDKVCDVTLSQINTLSEKGNIQLISFILLVLLIYLPMKTITFIIGIINYILIIILFKLGRYKIKKTNETVDRIELE